MVRLVIIFCLAGLLITLALRCERPECRNSNLIFNRYSPDKEPYKAELAKQLQLRNIENLSYWFDRYIEKEGRSYMHVHVQDDSLCAVMEIVLTDSERLEGIRRSSGMGYSGAELKGLKVAIIQNADSTRFYYKSLDAIID